MNENQKSLWNAQDMAALFDAELPKEWEARGVSIDTRTLQSGDLFVALVGDTLLRLGRPRSGLFTINLGDLYGIRVRT